MGLGQYAFPNQFDSSRELQVKTGKLTSKDQYYYFGQLEEDTNKWDGVGIWVESNGSIYEGYFNNDKLNGFGRYIYFNGDYYIGEWSDGCRHGQGTYWFAGGRRYVGGWKNYKYHGIGTEYSADGQISREGVWKTGIILDENNYKL